jgi:hypothetical protein
MFKPNNIVLHVLKTWIPLAITITCLSGLIYLVVQQDIRIGANDPQIQIAEDLASQLSTGQNPLALIPPAKTDISKSLANYIMLFNKDGKLVGSSALLDGKAPVLPQGLFAVAQKIQGSETRFTWQPKIGVRSAAVLVYYNAQTPGFILIGRSLREIEIRESQQEMIVFAGWLVTMFLSLSSVLIVSRIKS